MIYKPGKRTLFCMWLQNILTIIRQLLNRHTLKYVLPNEKIRLTKRIPIPLEYMLNL